MFRYFIILFSICCLSLRSVAMTVPDAYQLLGVNNSSDITAVKKAHRALSMTYHPDKHQNCVHCEQKTKMINDAYDVLIEDIQKRSKYPHLSELSSDYLVLIEKLTRVWDNLPDDEKEEIWNSWNEFRVNPEVGKDVIHTIAILGGEGWSKFLAGVNYFVFWIFLLSIPYNICAITGVCYLLWKIWKLVTYPIILLVRYFAGVNLM